VVLGSLADNGANTRSGCASNQASFESSAKYSAEDRTARASDGRAFAGADAAMALVVAVVSMARLVILSAVAALPDASVEIAVAVMALLRQTRQRDEYNSGGEESFSPWHSDSLLRSLLCKRRQ
jgi:hypothetical protein